MKQIDNRQKQQIFFRAEKIKIDKGITTPKSKEHAEEPSSPENSQKGSSDRKKPEVPVTFHRTAPKVGRNDACPCGSGNKYKKCCLLKSQ